MRRWHAEVPVWNREKATSDLLLSASSGRTLGVGEAAADGTRLTVVDEGLLRGLVPGHARGQQGCHHAVLLVEADEGRRRARVGVPPAGRRARSAQRHGHPRRAGRPQAGSAQPRAAQPRAQADRVPRHAGGGHQQAEVGGHAADRARRAHRHRRVAEELRNQQLQSASTWNSRYSKKTAAAIWKMKTYTNLSRLVYVTEGILPADGEGTRHHGSGLDVLARRHSPRGPSPRGLGARRAQWWGVGAHGRRRMWAHGRKFACKTEQDRVNEAGVAARSA